MNLFCDGHVFYVGIARQGGTMRTYTLLVFIRAYTPLVFMLLYSVTLYLSLSYTPVVFMYLYSLSDDDDEQQSDDRSEALPGGECLYLREVMGICATGKRGGTEGVCETRKFLSL